VALAVPIPPDRAEYRAKLQKPEKEEHEENEGHEGRPLLMLAARGGDRPAKTRFTPAFMLFLSFMPFPIRLLALAPNLDRS
jgi:hypothetical protein